jgi:hypothetical protein
VEHNPQAICFSLAYLALILLGLIYFISYLVSLIPKHFLRCERKRWEYGTCNGRHSRRDRKTREVQFILFNKGDQKSEYHPEGHAEDVWINFDSSWYKNFKLLD